MKNKERQTKLTELGYYNGPCDGKASAEYTAAVKKLQSKYFKRKQDVDGVPGSDTDKLINSVYNCRDLKYFKPEEFRCTCGKCTGYPASLDRQLLLNLEDLRKNSGSSIKVTSGLRCKYENGGLVGSSSTSRHMKGKAVDIYSSALTSTAAKRKALVKKWYSYKNANYAYQGTANMGNAVHLDVK